MASVTCGGVVDILPPLCSPPPLLPLPILCSISWATNVPGSAHLSGVGFANMGSLQLSAGFGGDLCIGMQSPELGSWPVLVMQQWLGPVAGSHVCGQSATPCDIGEPSGHVSGQFPFASLG